MIQRRKDLVDIDFPCSDRSMGQGFKYRNANSSYLGTDFHQDRDQHEHGSNLHKVNDAIPVHAV
jgi:hypothetical protein